MNGLLLGLSTLLRFCHGSRGDLPDDAPEGVRIGIRLVLARGVDELLTLRARVFFLFLCLGHGASIRGHSLCDLLAENEGSAHG